MTQDNNTNLLQRFFGEAGARSFLQDCWPGRPYVQDGDLARLGDIGAQPEFRDIRQLLNRLQTHVDLLHPDGRRQIVYEPVKALPAYLEGQAMLYIKCIENMPVIRRACDELADLLVIPRRYVGCEAFAAIGAVDVPIHFDHETNFMLQLRGTKTWQYAPNNDLPDPVFPFFPGNPNRYYDNGRHPYTGAPLSRTFPPSSVERIVHPGTVTFMPRGYWHATRTHDESFAIGFVINPPTMAELVISELLARLHARPEFRAHLLTAESQAGREDIELQLQKAISAIGDIAGGLSSATVLEAYLANTPANMRLLSHPRYLSGSHE